MTPTITLQFLTISASIPDGVPSYSRSATESFTSHQAAMARIDEVANGAREGGLQYTSVSWPKSFTPLDPLDVHTEANGKTLLVFEIDASCRCSFEPGQPFLDLTLKGAPDGGSICEGKVHGTSNMWASLEIHPHPTSSFARIPFAFNFLDNHTGRSPFYIQHHYKGGDKAYPHSHDGIHPLSAANTIDLA